MLEHIAVWTKSLESMKAFYCSYFEGDAQPKFVSDTEFDSHFESYFIAFPGGSRLELMQMATIPDSGFAPGYQATGLTHLAFAVERRELVEQLARRAEAEGLSVPVAPHMTGDGYYEACILDPDGNRVEVIVPPEDKGDLL